MLINIYNQEGGKIDQMKLPKENFEKKIKPDLIHQVVTVEQKNRRRPWAHTKNRSEARGGGRKPWRQKGTGRARHGSIRSPIWKGGGVTFGPRKDKSLRQNVNKKMKKRALAEILKEKIVKEDVFVLDKLTLKKPRTQELMKTIQKILAAKSPKKAPSSKRKVMSCLLVVEKIEKNLKLASRNIKKLSIEEARNVSPLTLLNFQKIILTKEAFHQLVKKTEISKNK